MAVATGREYGLFIDGGMAEPASGNVLDLNLYLETKSVVVGTGTRPANL
jgi:hypothetical protein